MTNASKKAHSQILVFCGHDPSLDVWVSYPSWQWSRQASVQKHGSQCQSRRVGRAQQKHLVSSRLSSCALCCWSGMKVATWVLPATQGVWFSKGVPLATLASKEHIAPCAVPELRPCSLSYL